MSERKINLEQILISKLEENSTEDFDLKIISKLHFIACYYAMKEACKQVLELAAENAKAENSGATTDSSGRIISGKTYVIKETIIDTIKQIE